MGFCRASFKQPVTSEYVSAIIQVLDGMLPVPFRTSELSQLARYSRASGHTPINQACSTFHIIGT